jgi:hypothetical protein
MGGIGRLLAVVTALVLALGVGGAMAETPIRVAGEPPVASEAPPAEGPSRKEYVSDLEKVCKPGAEATQRAMKGVRDDVKENRIPVATTKFEKATKIFGKTIKTIAREPRPAADVAKLKKWFVYLNRQEDYLKEISAQLRVDHKIKAQRLIGRFIHNGNLANNVTLAFGFDFCSFKFSRYGF